MRQSTKGVKTAEMIGMVDQGELKEMERRRWVRFARKALQSLEKHLG